MAESQKGYGIRFGTDDPGEFPPGYEPAVVQPVTTRSDELWNSLRDLDSAQTDIHRWMTMEATTLQYSRLAAVAAIEALAKVEDIDARTGRRSTE